MPDKPAGEPTYRLDVGLLRRVQGIIREEPHRLRMDAWMSPCGTICCIGGHVVILKGVRPDDMVPVTGPKRHLLLGAAYPSAGCTPLTEAISDLFYDYPSSSGLRGGPLSPWRGQRDAGPESALAAMIADYESGALNGW